jgi:hypothetical protein
MQELPSFLRGPLIVASYRAEVVNKRTVLTLLFDNMRDSYAKYVPIRDSMAMWTDDDYLMLPYSDEREAIATQREALRKTYEDSAAAMMLLAASSLERLHQALNEGLFDRGAASYIEGLRFSRAIWVLAVQYKHLGGWRHASAHLRDSLDVARLVDNALRGDAAAEFLRRCAFESYAEFERALLSCSDELTPDNLIPSGERGIPSVTMRVIPADEHQ